MPNWDDLLSYDTLKTVTIRDKTLGLIRYIFMITILCYVFINVFVNRAYNIHDSPLGSTRISLQSPKDIDMRAELFCPNHPMYFDPAHPSWNFTEERANPAVDGNPIACQAWDASNARYPADELDSIFVTTRLSIEQQSYQCGQKNTNAQPNLEDTCTDPYITVPNSNSVYFLAGVTNFTIGVSSSFYAPSPRFQMDFFNGNSREFSGKLKMGKDKYKYFPSEASDRPDVMTLGELLEAGGVDLASPSKTPTNSKYYSGVVLLVLQKFSNGEFSHMNEITYEYVVKEVTGSDYKLFENRQISDPNDPVEKRWSIKRAGVKIVFVISGDFHMWDTQTFVLQLVSGVGLMSISTILVEFLMLYVLKFRRYYRQAKYDDAVDGSNFVEDGEDGANGGDDKKKQKKADFEEQEVWTRDELINGKRNPDVKQGDESETVYSKLI